MVYVLARLLTQSERVGTLLNQTEIPYLAGLLGLNRAQNVMFITTFT